MNLKEYHGLSATMRLAKRYHGLAVLWEHRFYGDSQSFPVNVRLSSASMHMRSTECPRRTLQPTSGNSSPQSKPCKMSSSSQTHSPSHPVTPSLTSNSHYHFETKFESTRRPRLGFGLVDLTPAFVERNFVYVIPKRSSLHGRPPLLCRPR